MKADMVGTKRKGSKSKSRALNLVPEEPVPLKIINAEAAVSPSYGHSQKNDILNSDIVPGYGGWLEEEPMTDDEEEAAALANVDTEEEDVSDGSDTANNVDVENSNEETGEDEPVEDLSSDGGNAVTNVDVENSNKRTNDEETEEDDEPVRCGSDNKAEHTGEEEDEEEEEELEEDVSEGVEGVDEVTNMDVENSNQRTNDEEIEEDEEPVTCGSDNEEEHTGEEEEDGEMEEEEEEVEEDVSDEGDAVTNMDVENSNQRTNDEEIEEDEEPVSCGSDNEDEHTGEEGEEEEELEEEVSDEGEAVTNMDVENSNKATNEEETEEDEEPLSCDSDNEDVRASEEEDITAIVTNINKGVASPKYVLLENLTDNLENDKEANEPTAEDPISATAENEGDESGKEITSTTTDVKTVTEKVILLKKKIMGRRLIKKKMPLGKAVTAINGTKLQSSDGNEGPGVSCKADMSNEAEPQCLENDDKLGEASESGKTGNFKSEEMQRKPTVKVFKKLNKITKEKPQGQSGMQKGNDEQKPKPTNYEPSVKYNQTIEQETKIEEEGKSIARSSRLNNRKGENVMKEGNQKVNAKDLDKPGSSKKGKSTTKVDSTGMIFMCSSGTKKDCFKYKVFGLPAGKKDTVSKIYKGMRLFLYDVDCKTLNGIYKAAGRGGYNVEPRAFRSQFPSQVRFSVLQNCLPMPEEKFKKVIKDNYYSRNKFHCELTGEQVKNLCKLFTENTKKSESRHPSQSQRPAATSSTRVDRKRKWVEDSRRVRPGAISSREHERRRKRRPSPIVRVQEEIRRVHVVRDREEVRYRKPVVVYDREPYIPPVESSSLYQSFREEDPPRSRIYSYERDLDVDTYRREPAIVYLDEEISGSRESRHYARQNLDDPYEVTYRESRVDREPVYESDIRRREQYSYSSPERQYSEYYPADDYRPPLTLRRRY